VGAPHNELFLFLFELQKKTKRNDIFSVFSERFFYKNLYFGQKLRFVKEFVTKIYILDKNLDSLAKILIFHKKFDFFQKFIFYRKNYVYQ